MDNFSLDSILDKIKNGIESKITDIEKNLSSKFQNLDRNIIDKGLNRIQQKVDQTQVLLFGLYIIPVILLLYIIYLLNKYH